MPDILCPVRGSVCPPGQWPVWFCAMLAVSLLTGCARSKPRSGVVAASAPGVVNATGASAQNSAGGLPAGERLGTVHVIGTANRFVLVEVSISQFTSMLVDDQALVCRLAGSVTGTLRVSRERRPPFVVADVVAGEPHVGDEVFIDAAPARNVPATPPGVTRSPSPANSPAPDFRANPALPTAL